MIVLRVDMLVKPGAESQCLEIIRKLQESFQGEPKVIAAYSAVPSVRARGYAGSRPLGPTNDPNPIPP